MRSFLLYLQARDEAPALLAQALGLARELGAAVSILKVCYDPLVEIHHYIDVKAGEPALDEAQIRAALIADEEAWLGELLEAIPTQLVDVVADHRVIWSKRGCDQVLAMAQQQGVELIVKAAHVHSRLGELVHTPADWRLMREANCSVLLLRADGEPHAPGPVVAAVNPLEDDEDHHQLHVRVLDQAGAMAKALRAPLQVVAAVPMVNVASAYAMPVVVDDGEIQRHLLERAREALQTMLARYSIAADAVSVVNGPAEEVLRERCQPARLLVVGTVANKGLSALLLGNTAERILHAVDVDILVVN